MRLQKKKVMVREIGHEGNVVRWSVKVAIFNRVVWAGPAEKMALELKLEGGEDVNYVPLQRRSIPSEGRAGTGPEAV